MKPSYTSRGLGIYCTRALKDILTPSLAPQQKVVQKYIENPFLLTTKNLKAHKFDFRQWVLVLGWEPLDVCVFESAYLKICGQEFDLLQYEDIIRHLSNYSLNKGSKDASKDLVMNTKEF